MFQAKWATPGDDPGTRMVPAPGAEESAKNLQSKGPVGPWAVKFSTRGRWRPYVERNGPDRSSRHVAGGCALPPGPEGFPPGRNAASIRGAPCTHDQARRLMETERGLQSLVRGGGSGTPRPGPRRPSPARRLAGPALLVTAVSSRSAARFRGRLRVGWRCRPVSEGFILGVWGESTACVDPCLGVEERCGTGR